MLQLAGVLVIDLGLSPASATRSSDLIAESSLNTYAQDIPIPKQPSLDESRAILGLHFMNSMCVSNPNSELGRG